MSSTQTREARSAEESERGFSLFNTPVVPKVMDSTFDYDEVMKAKNQINLASYRCPLRKPLLFEAEPRLGRRRWAVITTAIHRKDRFRSSRANADTGEGFGDLATGLSVNHEGFWTNTGKDGLPVDSEGNILVEKELDPVSLKPTGRFLLISGSDPAILDEDKGPVPIVTLRPMRSGVQGSSVKEDILRMRAGFRQSRFGFPVTVSRPPGSNRDVENMDMAAIGANDLVNGALNTGLNWKATAERESKAAGIPIEDHPLFIIYSDWKAIPKDSTSNEGGRQDQGQKARSMTRVANPEELTGINPLEKSAVSSEVV